MIGTGSSASRPSRSSPSRPRELTVFQRTAQFTIPAEQRAAGSGSSIDLWKQNYPEWRRRGTRIAPAASRTRAAPCPRWKCPKTSGGRDLRGALGGRRRPRSLGTFSGPGAERGGEQDRGGVRLRDKIDEIVADPDGRGDAQAAGPIPIGTKRDAASTRTTTRPTTGRTSRWWTCGATPIEAITADRHADQRRRVRTRRDRVRDRVRRHDRPAAGDRHPRPRRAALARPGQDGPRTYLGLAVAGFPNLFIITGPGSPSVLSNMIVSIEQHVEWIARLPGLHARAGRRRDRGRREQAEDDWVEHVQRGRPARRSTRRRRPGTWAPTFPASRGCSCPTSAASAAYRHKCDQVAANGYEGFALILPESLAGSAASGHGREGRHQCRWMRRPPPCWSS